MNLMQVKASFDATHEDENESKYLHGHHYEVSVIEQLRGEMCQTLEKDLNSLLLQLHLRKLSDMLYGGSQSLVNIGAWIMERLLGEHPTIIEIEVSIGSTSGIVRREIR